MGLGVSCSHEHLGEWKAACRATGCDCAVVGAPGCGCKDLLLMQMGLSEVLKRDLMVL